MSTQAAASTGSADSIVKIVVRIKVGEDRMAGTDDPIFLCLSGGGGRQFRLSPARGRGLRRGAEDVYVLGAPDAPDTNVAHPDLNDPGSPPILLADVQAVCIVKGLEPLPNVRGLGEMDDRLLIDRVEVEIYSEQAPKATHFQRQGPIWLGLICGLRAELTRVEPPA